VATDLTVYLADEPGELARLAEVLATEGVNIDGFCAMTSGGGQAEIHILVDDAGLAFTALQKADIAVASEQEVEVVSVEDRPGVLADVSRKLGEAGVNITLAYLATDTRLVFAADDMSTAKDVLS